MSAWSICSHQWAVVVVVFLWYTRSKKRFSLLFCLRHLPETLRKETLGAAPFLEAATCTLFSLKSIKKMIQPLGKRCYVDTGLVTIALITLRHYTKDEEKVSWAQSQTQHPGAGTQKQGICIHPLLSYFPSSLTRKLGEGHLYSSSLPCRLNSGVWAKHSRCGTLLHYGTLGAFTPSTFPRNSSRNFYFLELSSKSRSHRNKSLLLSFYFRRLHWYRCMSTRNPLLITYFCINEQINLGSMHFGFSNFWPCTTKWLGVI